MVMADLSDFRKATYDGWCPKNFTIVFSILRNPCVAKSFLFIYLFIYLLVYLFIYLFFFFLKIWSYHLLVTEIVELWRYKLVQLAVGQQQTAGSLAQSIQKQVIRKGTINRTN